MTEDDPTESLYSPRSRDALALGLPDQVAGLALLSGADDTIALEEHEYATDVRVRQILVDLGLGPSSVTIAQKGPSRLTETPEGERIPPVGLAAVQVKEVPASQFVEWDPTFYLLLTSVQGDDYKWQGEKPGRERALIGEREVWLADFGRFKVSWYPYGDVLYVIVATNDQLLEASIQSLPWPREAT